MSTTISARPDRPNDRSARALFVVTVSLVAWGALAFGSPYPWAYAPLALGSGVLGVLLVWRARQVSGSRIGDASVLAALAAIAAAAGLQLVPTAPAVREWLSPSSTALLQSVDLRFAASVFAQGGPAAGPWHTLSVNPAQTAKGLALFLAFAMLLVGLTSFFSREGVAPLVPSLLGFALALACIGIVQKAVLGDHAYGGMRIYGFWEPKYKLTTPFGPFVNKNHFAGWMVMALPVAIGYFLGRAEVGMRHVRRGWRNRLLWLSSSEGGQLQLVAMATVIMAASLMMSRSRSGIACFGVAIVIAAVVAVRHQRGWRGRLTILTALLMLLVVPLSWSRVDVVKRFSTGTSDPSIQLRREVWSDTIRIIRDFPLTGTGLNTFATATMKYQTARTNMQFREAHNEYLQVAAEGGLLLGIPAAAALLFLVREVYRRFRENADDRATYWLRFGATTGLIAIGLQSLVEFSLQMPGNTALFVVLCAMALHRAPSALVEGRSS